jgi:hypothetical protein
MIKGQIFSDTASLKRAEINKEIKLQKSTISMDSWQMPDMQYNNFLPVISGYRMHDLAIMQPLPSRLDFDATKLNLNLQFVSPQKKLASLLKEEPAKALLYVAAYIAGMLNHNIEGEDKRMKKQMDCMINSRSGVPESARSANHLYEIKNE